jgi:prepilin-type processing-associated H-X9-DG protein
LSGDKQIGLAATMYANDYDDILPETGWDGPCSQPAPATAGGYVAVSDNYFSGVFAWPLAIQPYTKNYGILACPSDPYKDVYNKTGSYCYEEQLILMNVPGAYVGMSAVPGAMGKVLPMSMGGNYEMSENYDPQIAGDRNHRTSATKEFPNSQVNSPANVFYVADVGSAQSGATFFGGWYIIPGYGNSSSPTTNRWVNGMRHSGGRNWVFCDGHAKYAKDEFVNNGINIITQYQHKGIYTYPQTDGADYVSPY